MNYSFVRISLGEIKPKKKLVLNRLLSVNSQSGGQNNKIVLHFKGLIL